MGSGLGNFYDSNKSAMKQKLIAKANWSGPSTKGRF